MTSGQLRKYTQTITLQVEFWGTGDNLQEAPQSWEWFRAGSPHGDMGGDLYGATVEAAGPIELVERHDYDLRYAGGQWDVLDTEGDKIWEPRFRGTHAEAVAWVAEHGGVIRS